MLESKIPLIDGKCRLVPSFLRIDQADKLFNTLQREIYWHQPELIVFGNKVKSPRLAAWYGDKNASYTYSGVTNKPLPWSRALYQLKEKVESFSEHQFNSVLLNLYRDGKDAMGWHADDEKELGLEPVIASCSLGQVRRFRLKHNTVKKYPPISLDLEHGSLLMMSGSIQRNWKHCITRTKKEVGPRINLTFRYIYG